MSDLLSQTTPRPGRETDDFLWRHLKELPAFRALLRAVEAQFYQALLPLEEPVLDLGCGDGHFAAVAFPAPLAAGIDPDAAMLREARQRAAHGQVAQALGDALPFAGAHFSTLVSNSVLEHIPDLEPVLAEAARVLRPGGRFLFTVPGERFSALLLFPQLLRTLRMERLARGYERFFHRVSRHQHCDGVACWQERLAAHGFRVERCFAYFSARAHHALDLGHYLGAPSLVARRLTGRWILAPSRWNLALTERLLRPLYEEALSAGEGADAADVSPGGDGAYLFFVATRAP